MLANPTYNRAKHNTSSIILVSAVLLLTLIVGLICVWLMFQTVATYYASRIYPNVYVMGLKLGRMTPEEATVLLNSTAHQTGTGLLILHDGENRWSVPWSEAGMYLDVSATVQAALSIGHADDLRWQDQVRMWLARQDVAPLFSVESERARRVLERLAPSVAVAPTDATLHLPKRADEPVVAVPGQLGRELDIEATLAQLLASADGQAYSTQIDLVFRSIAPRIADAKPFQAQVEEMLGRRIELSTYDVLTDEVFSWILGRGDIASWLRITPSPDGPTAVLQPEAIQVTLAELAAELGDGRAFRWSEATRHVTNAFNRGGGTVTLYMTHPERTYIVRPGDSLSSIATTFGMTAWHVMQANPGVEPNWLYPGQELAIPSQDELTPFAPVSGKRVVISTTEQKMRVFENGKEVYTWSVSTGVTESPTHTGVFQVLSKEENAYASLWDLWMPHFIAIYAAGPDFYNGVHGLPTLSSGRRLWDGLLGSPASYGCIILGLEEAETFYHWVERGVVVVIQ